MKYGKLGRNSGHRKALFRNLVTSLFKYGKIETTEAKAKEINSITEKMVTLAKKGDLNSRRIVLGYLVDETVVKDLFDNIAPRYADRSGGYTRLTKLGPRRGDAADLVIIELV